MRVRRARFGLWGHTENGWRQYIDRGHRRRGGKMLVDAMLSKEEVPGIWREDGKGRGCR